MFHLPPRLNRPRGTLYMPTSILGAMLDEGWSNWPLETGGILLGRRTAGTLQVTRATGPGPDATHDRYAFTPNSDWQAEQVALAWKQDPTIEYLGDWHTHPGGTTRFSPLDHETAQSIAKYAAARQPQPVMLVLALGHNMNTRVAAAQLIDGRLQQLTLSQMRSGATTSDIRR